MAARAALLLCIAATALAGCTETLRVPPTSDGAGLPGASDANPYASTAPPAAGVGLVSGSGARPDARPGDASDGAAGDGGGDAGVSATPPPPRVPPAWISEGKGRYLLLEAAAIGMSQAGDRVLEVDGTLWIDGGPSPSMLVDTVTGVQGISADGSTVFGSTIGPPCPRAAFWTLGGGVRPQPQSGYFTASSADGRWLVGSHTSADCSLGPGTTSLVLMMALPGGSFSPGLDGDDLVEGVAASANGQSMIGFSSSSVTHTGRFFSWASTGPGPAQPVALHATKVRRPMNGVFTSADGSVVALAINDSGYLWSADATGLKLFGSASQVSGLSADGSVVLALSEAAVPYRWSAKGGIDELPATAPEIDFASILMTPDASLVIGNPGGNSAAPVVVWQGSSAPRFLFDDAPTFSQRCHPYVNSVSGDGKTFAGVCAETNRATGFIARF